MFQFFFFLENSIILFSIYTMKLEFSNVMRRITKVPEGKKSKKNLYFHLSFGCLKYLLWYLSHFPFFKLQQKCFREFSFLKVESERKRERKSKPLMKSERKFLNRIFPSWKKARLIEQAEITFSLDWRLKVSKKRRGNFVFLLVGCKKQIWVRKNLKRDE